MKYFFDSYAIIELINQNPNYNSFLNEQIVTNSLNLGEVYYYLLKTQNKQTADYWMRILSLEFIDVSSDITVEASQFKFENKQKGFSYPDCIGYISALKSGLVFLTGDREFKDMKNVEFVK